MRYGNDVFLTLNQETVENDVYYRSSCLRTNVNLSVVVDDNEVTIPCFAAEATDYNPENSPLLSIVSNTVRLTTEDNQYSRAVQLNDYFEVLGGAYSVSNIVYKDSISTIYLKRTQKNPKDIFMFLLDGEVSYKLNEVAQFTVRAFINDKMVQNASVEWMSDDTNIVNIDENGNASFIGTGEATITARWIQHDITATLKIEIFNIDIRSCSIIGDSDILYKSSQIYSVEFLCNGIPDAAAIPKWSRDIGSEITLNPKVSVTDNNDGTATVTVTNDNSTVGKFFEVVVTDINGLYSARKRVKIVQYKGGW